MAKRRTRPETSVSDILQALGIGNRTFLVALGTVVALGGTYGGYVITRSEQGPDTGTRYVATRVIDGDTIEISDRQNNTQIERIRLIDVNAPELDMCYGAEAKEALEKLLAGKDLYIEKDISGSDDMGRLVRYVRVLRDSKHEDNVLTNTWLLANGYAVYRESENSLHQKEILRSSTQDANV